MINTRVLVAGLVGLGALAGCASASPQGPEGASLAGDPSPDGQKAAPVDGKTALAHVDQNLARLKALDVFAVGELIVALPEEATNCYGPCPGSEGAIEKAKEAAAIRLETFTGVAEAAAQAPVEGACEPAAIDENLAALEALSIVKMGGLIEVAPKNNPSCYNLPCQEDKDAAAAATCAHAGELASIAKAAKGL